jgi:hypothetical protein
MQTGLTNSFILFSGYSSFFVTNKPNKRNHSVFKKKMDILAQVDPNKETNVAQPDRLRTALTTLITIVKYMIDNEKCHAQRGRFSGNRKSLKQLPLQELESLLIIWFKQASAGNAVISGTMLRKKALHTAIRLGILNRKVSNAWTEGLNQQQCCVQNCIGMVKNCTF